MNTDEAAIIKWLTLSVDTLPKIGDIELATLKIHIVLEDALKFLLSQRLISNEDAFNKLRIEFSKLLEITLSGIDKPHLLRALRSLNAARNKIAHNINPLEVSEKLKIFVREIADMQGEKLDWPSDLQGQLKSLAKAFYDAGFAIFDFAFNQTPKKGT